MEVEAEEDADDALMTELAEKRLRELNKVNKGGVLNMDYD